VPYYNEPPPLWEHQLKDIEFCKSNPLVFNTSDCGTGKTRVCLELIRQLKLPTLVLAPKSILAPAWSEDINKYTPELTHSVAYAHNRKESFQQESQVIVTNHDAVKYLAEHPELCTQFKDGLLIVDECFVRDTPISTPHGLVPIQKLTIGDLVCTSNGVYPITNTFKSSSTNLVSLRLSNGKQFRCTKNHPIATDLGWLPAGSCAGRYILEDRDLRALRRYIQTAFEVQSQMLLLKIMFEKSFMAERTFKDGRSYIQSSRETTRTFYMEQRNFLVRRGSRKIISITQRNRPIYQFNSGREWKRDVSDGAEVVNSFTPAVYMEPTYTYWPTTEQWISYMLQTGFWKPYLKNWHRSRWNFTSYCTRTAERSEEIYFSNFTRVDCVSNIQRRSGEDVWNLEVDGPHNYIANGIVVHNCTAFKNPKTQRSSALDAIRDRFARVILMSGTPNPNGVCDLWHQLYILDRGARLGRSFYKFRSVTCTPRSRGAFTEWVEKEGILDIVASLFADITIRHRLEDCIDLPENHVYTTEIELPPVLREHYKAMKKRARLIFESSTVTAVNAAALLQKLLQVASGAVYDDFGGYKLLDSSRYDYILDLVEERPHSLVAFNWHHQRDQLVEGAKKRKLTYGVLDSSVPIRLRNLVVEDFQEGKLRVLFAHPQSAGHGLTLTKATSTIWSSPTYNLEHFAQFNHRIYRGGQTQKTETVLVSAKETADVQAYAQLIHKNVNMAYLLDILTC
jgi:hypothetical protein